MFGVEHVKHDKKTVIKQRHSLDEHYGCLFPSIRQFCTYGADILWACSGGEGTYVDAYVTRNNSRTHA